MEGPRDRADLRLLHSAPTPPWGFLDNYSLPLCGRTWALHFIVAAMTGLDRIIMTTKRTGVGKKKTA